MAWRIDWHIFLAIFVTSASLCTFVQASTIYVDDDGPADFNSIQVAIDEAAEGDEIVVAPGTYYENIVFGGKDITLRSTDPMNADVVAKTVINGTFGGSVVTFSGMESANCMLSGFTVTGGKAGSWPDYSCFGGGIYGKGTGATIQYNVIKENQVDPSWMPSSALGGGICNCDGTIQYNVVSGNRATGDEGSAAGGGLYGCDGTIQYNVICDNSALEGGGLSNCDGSITNCVVVGNKAWCGGGIFNCSVIRNCTISNNSASEKGGGIYCYGSETTLSNCILWGNVAAQGEQIALYGYAWHPSSVMVSYSNVQGGSEQVYVGPGDRLNWPAGNINVDPCFADTSSPDPNEWDYHLKSQAGRWDPTSWSWVQDDVTSLCIDKGDPNSPVAAEPLPNGCRVNMGAYGDTVEASKSYFGSFVLSTNAVNVPEGGTVTFRVWLFTDPGGVIKVSVLRKSGDTDIAVLSGGELVFDSSNYWEPHVVVVAGSEDSDYFNGVATIEISCSGYLTAEVWTQEWDNDMPSVLYVDADAVGTNNGTSWEHAFADLHEALSVARRVPAAEEIHVAEGIYTPATPSGDRRATFQLISGVAVRGGYAGLSAPDPDDRDVEKYKTILSGDLGNDDVDVLDPCDLLREPTRSENSFHVVNGSWTDDTSVLDGFIIRGGNASEIENGSGGGMLIFSGSPKIADCIFTVNSAFDGGGMASYWGSPGPTVVNCTFSRNYGYTDGGGMRGGATLIGCTFNDNVAAYGGGIACTTGDGSLRSIECTFSGNSASWYGGGVELWSGGQSIFVDCEFSRNKGGEGGGLYSFNTCCTLTNCIFSDNFAIGGYKKEGCGGGLHHHRHVFRDETLVFVTNCTFVGNSAIQDGGGLYGLIWPQVRLTNSIFWSNVDGGGLDESAQVHGQGGSTDYCCIQGWTGAIAGTGNIDADPNFADEGYWDPNGTPDDPSNDFWIDGDYHLKSQSGRWDPNSRCWVKDNVTSQCIDAGDPGSPIGYEPFPNGGIINMGAYGGTAEASKSYFGQSVCETVVAGDINGDCRVDFADFELVALHWLDENQ